MSGTDDLTEFLAARIDDDHERTRAMQDDERRGRAIREVAARRLTLAEHDTRNWQAGDRVHDCQWQTWPCRTLRLLALPYMDHPDYRQEWKP